MLTKCTPSTVTYTNKFCGIFYSYSRHAYGEPDHPQNIHKCKSRSSFADQFSRFLLTLKEFPLSTTSRHRGGGVLQLHSFSTSALAGGEWLPSSPGRCTSAKNLQFPLNWRLSGIQAGVDVSEYTKISCSCRDSNPGLSRP